jgi:hypothetical protein
MVINNTGTVYLSVELVSSTFSRYCQLCATSEAVDGQLRNGRHKFDETDASTVEKFNDVCEKVSATEYSVTRKVTPFYIHR